VCRVIFNGFIENIVNWNEVGVHNDFDDFNGKFTNSNSVGVQDDFDGLGEKMANWNGVGVQDGLMVWIGSAVDKLEF